MEGCVHGHALGTHRDHTGQLPQRLHVQAHPGDFQGKFVLRGARHRRVATATCMARGPGSERGQEDGREEGTAGDLQVQRAGELGEEPLVVVPVLEDARVVDTQPGVELGHGERLAEQLPGSSAKVVDQGPGEDTSTQGPADKVTNRACRQYLQYAVRLGLVASEVGTIHQHERVGRHLCEECLHARPADFGNFSRLRRTGRVRSAGQDSQRKNRKDQTGFRTYLTRTISRLWLRRAWPL